MNRTTALALALAALLAHTLAIHHDAAHRFAGPIDEAYVSFHLARNWAQTGDFVWNAQAGGELLRGGLESYPSLLWMWLMGASEWFGLPTQPLSQLLGILASLAVVVLSARFATDRIAGVVTPALLVASGGLASAASGGTELATVTLLVTASFVAFEHRWRRRFVLAATLLAAARPEGCLMVAGLFLLATLERVFPRRDGSQPTSLRLFLPALAMTALGFWLRTSTGHSLYASQLAATFDADGERLVAGWRYVLDAARTSVMPLLLFAPFLALALGKLSGAGLRALGLGLLWTAIVVLQGGGPAPFGLALVPGLPLLYLSIQQGMILGLDTGRRLIELLCWILILTAMAMSALASKFPGNLGPLKLDEWHRSWMTSTEPADFDHRSVLGRLALDDEIRLAADMRSLSSFLNVNGQPEQRILTPTPGLLGYASGMVVEDLYARTQPDASGQVNLFWRPPRRVDWVAALERRPELIQPGRLGIEAVGQQRFFSALARGLILFDVDPSAERDARLQELLLEYELLAVPVYPPGRDRRPPVYLLRRKDCGHAPRLEIVLDSELLSVRTLADESVVEDHILRLAWLQVVARNARGREWNLTPSGEFVEDRRRSARTDLMLDPEKRAAMTLYRGALTALPDGSMPVAYVARLISPGALGNHPIGIIGEEVQKSVE